MVNSSGATSLNSIAITDLFDDSKDLRPDWIPLPQIARGVAIGNYHHQSVNSPCASLDLGDLVYIFEIDSSKKWYRGYVVSTPLSQSPFHIVSNISPLQSQVVTEKNENKNKTSIVKLLQPDVSIGIFPACLISTKEYYNSPTPTYSKRSVKSSQPDLIFLPEDRKPTPPALPHLRLEYKILTVNSEPIVDDIISVIEEWYDIYVNSSLLQGDITTAETLGNSIGQLDIIRRKITHGLLTYSEREVARKKAISLICRASKVLNRGIVVRDPLTGDVLSSRGNEVRLAQEQMLLALAPNYPESLLNGNVASTSLLPKNLLVNIVSLVGEGYNHSVDIIMYIRTKVRRITESFKAVLEEGSSVTDLPTVLFRDIPLSVLKSEVYLVVEMYYENPVVSPQVNLSEKKGLVVGVTDITRLFRLQGTSKIPFPIRLYANDYVETNKENKGWGELATRIITGNPFGVAVTNDAREMVCMVNDFEAGTVNDSNSNVVENYEAIQPVNSLFVNCRSQSRTNFYITFGTLSIPYSLSGISKDGYFSLVLSSPRNNILFSCSSNGPNLFRWRSISIRNGESSGEMVCAQNINPGDILCLDLYGGNKFIQHLELELWKGSQIISGKCELDFKVCNTPITLKLTIEYVGTKYNFGSSIEDVLNWELLHRNNRMDRVIATIKRCSEFKTADILKHSFNLIDQMLRILICCSKEHTDRDTDTVFVGILNILSRISKESINLKYLENMYINEFNIGQLSSLILRQMEQVIFLSNANHILIDLFKCSPVLLRLLRASCTVDSTRNQEVYSKTLLEVAEYAATITLAIKQILRQTDSGFVEVKVTIIKVILECYQILSPLIGQDSTVKYLIELVDSIESTSFHTRREKLLLIRCLSDSWVYNNKKYRSFLAGHTIKWALEYLIPRVTYIKGEEGNSDNEVSVYEMEHFRLLCGIFAKQLRAVGAEGQLDTKLHNLYGKLLPILCNLYSGLLDKFINSHASPRTAFSPLFPDNYPFETWPRDSLVNDSIFDETLIELGIVITMLVDRVHSVGNFKPSEDSSMKRDKDIISQFIIVATKMIESPPFPDSWISLHAVNHEASFNLLNYISSTMITHFIPKQEDFNQFDLNLWYSYLSCIAKLAGSELLISELLSEQNRRAIHKIAPDLRNRSIKLFKTMWDALGRRATDEEVSRFGISLFGRYQIQLIGGEYSLLSPVLNLCLLKRPLSQVTEVEILYSMIISEWLQHENIDNLKREMAVSTDDIFTNRKYLPEDRDKRIFQQQILKLIEFMNEDDVAYRAIMRNILEVIEFLDMLLDLYNIPSGGAFSDDRTFHALNVLNFLRDCDQEEKLVRYVFDIVATSIPRRNYTEAGLALQLLTNSYEWRYDQRMSSVHGLKNRFHLPEQSAFERKEALYEMMIQFFIRGQAYELAAEAVQELMRVYELVSFDFFKLSGSCAILGKLYHLIDSKERLMPEYFRVVYLGVGFPSSLQGRQFIFEGMPGDKLQTIHDRLLQTYPGATIISHESQAKSDTQYLYVSSVVPEPPVERRCELSELLSTKPAASPYSRSHMMRLDLRRFSYSRPLAGNKSSPQIWVEKTVYETYQSFPTIVKRSEVKTCNVQVISPVETALTMLTDKILDLIELENIFRAEKSRGPGNQDIVKPAHVQMLDLVLSGAIDSPVNGGINVFRNYLKDKALWTDESSNDLMIQLKKALLDYTAAVQRTLVYHGERVLPSLKPHHDLMVQIFEENYKNELDQLAIESSSLSRERYKWERNFVRSNRIVCSMFENSDETNRNSADKEHKQHMSKDSQQLTSKESKQLLSKEGRQYRERKLSSIGSERSSLSSATSVASSDSWKVRYKLERHK